MTLVLRPVSQDALLLEQLQHILGLYSEDLSDGSLEEQPLAELATDTHEAEVAPQPGEFLVPCLLLLYGSEEFLLYDPVQNLLQAEGSSVYLPVANRMPAP